MATPPVDDRLRNYRTLLKKVDERCREIERNCRAHIACRKGCAECCRHFSIFPVEAAALSEALQRLTKEQADHILEKARNSTPESPCPLLEKRICLLYKARPVICRTHGLPLLYVQDGQTIVDFCPLNFRDLDSIPGNAVIHLDRLNEMLASVNRLFVAEFFGFSVKADRLSIAEALLENFEKPSAPAPSFRR
jgi:Fe-S-cluster containining protein